MSNTITIELCAEDRARLDKLTAALEARAATTPTADEPHPDPIQQKLAETIAKAETPAEPTKPAAEDAETSAPPVTPAEEEKPTAKEDAPAEEPEPTVTLEQIQQKVMQLAAGNGGAKKAKVREIINLYGSKVSDLKEQPEKWTEVWKKLTALESEG
jgi:hypothetical protein